MFEKNIFSILWGFLLGVFGASHFIDFSLPRSSIFFILFILGITFFLLKPRLHFLVYFVLSCFVGGLFFQMKLDPPEKTILDYFVDEHIELDYRAQIISRPIQKKDVVSMQLEIQSLAPFPDKNIHTKVLLKTPLDIGFRYGQIVEFSAVPQKAQNFQGAGGRIFDYQHFLEKDGIHYIMKSRSVRIVDQSKGGFVHKLYSLKDFFLQKIYRILPKKEASLLAGVLLGEKTALNKNLEQGFRDTGLMHIVVLSGYNVSLVILAVMILLRPFPLSVRSSLAVIGIVCFALLVGAGPTVVRASIMAMFVVFGQIFGRSVRVERGLLLAGVAMVLWNPWVLYFDISFQLSFLATYGIIIFPALFEKYFLWVPDIFAFRESLVATLSAQVMVMPLIVYYIGDFSLVAPVVNMLVLFMVPVVMAFGFIMILASWIYSPIVFLFSFPALFGLKYIIFVVELFSKIPFASIHIPSFSPLFVFLYYGIIFFLIYHKNIYHKDDLLLGENNKNF